MSIAITPSLRTSMLRLKHAGEISGICLGWKRQLLVNLMPYEDFRVEQMIQTVIDGREHFQIGGDRDIQIFSFSYSNIHLLTLFKEDLTLQLLHQSPGNVDFLINVTRTFLHDAQILIYNAIRQKTDENAQHPAQDQNSSLSEPNLLAHLPAIDPNRTHFIE